MAITRKQLIIERNTLVNQEYDEHKERMKQIDVKEQKDMNAVKTGLGIYAAATALIGFISIMITTVDSTLFTVFEGMAMGTIPAVIGAVIANQVIRKNATKLRNAEHEHYVAGPHSPRIHQLNNQIQRVEEKLTQMGIDKALGAKSGDVYASQHAHMKVKLANIMKYNKLLEELSSIRDRKGWKDFFAAHPEITPEQQKDLRELAVGIQNNQSGFFDTPYATKSNKYTKKTEKKRNN